MIKQFSLGKELETLWNQLYSQSKLQVPFLTYAWHELWFRTLGTTFTPYILVIDDKMIFPFARQEQTVIFSGGNEIADYLDIIGAEELKPKAWREILEFLHTQEIYAIQLRNVPQDSSTLTFFQSLPSTGIEIKIEDTTPLMTLPSDWETYLSQLSRKYRHELKRKMHKFETLYPQAQIVESQKTQTDQDIFMQLLKQNAQKEVFLTQEMETFFYGLFEQFSKEIWLLFLEVDAQKVATALSFIINDNLYLYNSGFDRTHFSSAGFYLKAKSIELAIQKGFKEYNFLQGNERYKYELGGKDFSVFEITLDFTQ